MKLPITPWVCEKKTEILNRSPWLCLEEHHVRLPDGADIEDWLWVKTPDFINVVAITESGEWLCFRQQKYAVEGLTLSIVGGYVEEGEDPGYAAMRELKEETGYESEEWDDLGSYAIDGNRGCGNGHLFLARNCRFIEKGESDDLEDQELLKLSKDEVVAALRKQKFGVMPWVAAIALALVGEG